MGRCSTDGHELTISLPVNRLVEGQYVSIG